MINFLKELKQKPFYENIVFHEPNLAALPLFNLDFERNGSKLWFKIDIPNSVRSLRDIVNKSSGVLIAEP